MKPEKIYDFSAKLGKMVVTFLITTHIFQSPYLSLYLYRHQFYNIIYLFSYDLFLLAGLQKVE